MARRGENTFDELMEAVKVCSLGQIMHAFRDWRPLSAEYVMTQATFDTPIGPVRAMFTDAGALCSLCFVAEATDLTEEESPAAELRAQVNAYFSGKRRSFDIPLSLEGSAFERRVWVALQAVPYGTTISYRALAAQLEGPEAAQAVGRACAANPVLIVVPCHRVVGADSALTGYAGGAERKAALLRHEGALLF